MKRGIANSSLSNVSKICKALNISVDELEHNRIVPLDSTDNNEEQIELDNLIQFYKFKLQKAENITLDNIKLNDNEKYLILDSMDILLEQLRRKRERFVK